MRPDANLDYHTADAKRKAVACFDYIYHYCNANKCSECALDVRPDVCPLDEMIQGDISLEDIEEMYKKVGK